MRVLIADDHALLRQGLVDMLRAEEPGWNFVEAADFATMQAAIVATPPELLILDLRMPGMAGEITLRRLRQAYPTMLIVVLSGVDDRAAILSCLDSGVHGYVLKAMASDEILAALQSVLDGHVFVPPMLALGVARLVVPHGNAIAQKFTSRQIEVLNLLAEGRSTKDIARALNLGVGTVKVHLAAIYRILGAHNRMEAVMRAGTLRG